MFWDYCCRLLTWNLIYGTRHWALVLLGWMKESSFTRGVCLHCSGGRKEDKKNRTNNEEKRDNHHVYGIWCLVTTIEKWQIHSHSQHYAYKLHIIQKSLNKFNSKANLVLVVFCNAFRELSTWFFCFAYSWSAQFFTLLLYLYCRAIIIITIHSIAIRRFIV